MVENVHVIITVTSDPECEWGINSGPEGQPTDVCCSSSCGTCGGTGCSSRPGGGDNCCVNSILDSGMYCSDHVAPCIIDASLNNFTVTVTGKDLLIFVLVIANALTLAVLVRGCTKSRTGRRVKYEAVGVVSESEV